MKNKAMLPKIYNTHANYINQEKKDYQNKNLLIDIAFTRPTFAHMNLRISIISSILSCIKLMPIKTKTFY
jgi:hypothetical protein